MDSNLIAHVGTTCAVFYAIIAFWAYNTARDSVEDTMTDVSDRVKTSAAVLLTLFWLPVAAIGAALCLFDLCRPRTENKSDLT